MTPDQLLSRQKLDYVASSSMIIDILVALDAEHPQSKYLLENYFDLVEFSFPYDEFCEYLESDLRKGRPVSFSCVQIKEILRLKYMLNKFDSLHRQFEGLGYGSEFLDAVTRHPQWVKMSAQAHKILEMLKIENQQYHTPVVWPLSQIKAQKHLMRQRFVRQYIKTWPELLMALESFAGVGPDEVRAQEELFSFKGFSRYESLIVRCCEGLKDEHRHSSKIHLSKNQFKDILRLKQQLRKFKKDLFTSSVPSPTKNTFAENFYWLKIRHQANNTLESFLRK